MNPLYDALFGRHRGAGTPFLILPDGAVLSHGDFLAQAARLAHALTESGLRPGDRLAAQ
ncbi:MAG TPA: malonyl-CoA synthase, partial [Chromatiaceae bacterium]|nr:malonyl-CoA synthase [Chromatiaceae bacterium]